MQSEKSRFQTRPPNLLVLVFEEELREVGHQPGHPVCGAEVVRHQARQLVHDVAPLVLLDALQVVAWGRAQNGDNKTHEWSEA